MTLGYSERKVDDSKLGAKHQDNMPNDSGAMMHPNGLPFEETVMHLRRSIKAFAVLTKDCLRDHPYWKAETDGVADEPEMRANLALCYRHLEDAAMRLGKVIQAKDGGRSVDDK